MTACERPTNGAATVRLDGACNLVIERFFAAPPARVFAAWTEPERISAWWDPSGAPLAEVEMDLQPGGRFRLVHAVSSGSHVFAGIYRRIDPPALLGFDTPAPGGGETIGTVQFNPEDGGTRLVLTMACPSADARAELLRYGVDKGTAQTLDNLDRFLNRDAPDT